MDQQKTLFKSRNAIMKFLPRAATSPVTFQRPPMIYNPLAAPKDKKSSEKTAGHKSNLGIGFSGPLVSSSSSSMAPAGHGRKITKKSSNKQSDNNCAIITYDNHQPPTSPRVSCMGQVRYQQKDKPMQRANKNKNNNNNQLLLPGLVDKRTTRKFNIDDREETPKTGRTNHKSKKKLLGFKTIFSSTKKDIIISSKAADPPLYLDDHDQLIAPNLGTIMKRFSSGRRSRFSSIDWTNYEEISDEEQQQKHVIMPSSAPVGIRRHSLLLGSMDDDKFVRIAGINKEPKKEINLWKRRTLPQPKPLQVN